MSRLYGLKIFLLICLFILAVPFYAFAEEFNGDVVEPYGAGEWDYKGQENITFAYTKQFITQDYYATDGGNFKIDMTSSLYSSNYVQATIYINGNQGGTRGTQVINNKGTIEFSGIPTGAKVWFHIIVSDYDTFNFKFYD